MDTLAVGPTEDYIQRVPPQPSQPRFSLSDLPASASRTEANSAVNFTGKRQQPPSGFALQWLLGWTRKVKKGAVAGDPRQLSANGRTKPGWSTGVSFCRRKLVFTLMVWFS